MDVHQSSLWAEYMTKLGWQTEKLGDGFAYIKKLSVIGSIIKIPKFNPSINLDLIDNLAKKHQALFVKVEPLATTKEMKLEETLKKSGFQSDTWSLQPTKTLIINLNDTEEEILAGMEKDTRYSIRAAEKRGVSVIQNDDIDTFWNLYKQTAKRGRFWVTASDIRKLWEVFSKGNNAAIFVAQHSGESLAAAFVLFQDDTAYYHHAGSSDQHRELYATYLVIWKIILAAKKRGCHKLDLMGIVDPRIPATKSWGGFSHFKRGFGGEEVSYLGSFTKFYNPLMRWLFFFNRFSL